MLLVYHYSVLQSVSEGGNYCPLECEEVGELLFIIVNLIT